MRFNPFWPLKPVICSVLRKNAPAVSGPPRRFSTGFQRLGGKHDSLVVEHFCNQQHHNDGINAVAQCAQKNIKL